MTISLDPAENETLVLRSLGGNLQGEKILEIGCGDGRLTWRYASHAGQVVAIDPNPDRIAQARAQIPQNLVGKVEFYNQGLETFIQTWQGKYRFDQVLLSWSL